MEFAIIFFKQFYNGVILASPYFGLILLLALAINIILNLFNISPIYFITNLGNCYQVKNLKNGKSQRIEYDISIKDIKTCISNSANVIKDRELFKKINRLAKTYTTISVSNIKEMIEEPAFGIILVDKAIRKIRNKLFSIRPKIIIQCENDEVDFIKTNLDVIKIITKNCGAFRLFIWCGEEIVNKDALKHNLQGEWINKNFS